MANKTKFTIGDAVGFGWKTFWANVGILLLIAVVYFAVNLIPSLISGTAPESTIDAADLLSSALSIVCMILAIGMVKISLDFASNKETSVKYLFTEWRYFVRYILATVVYGLIVTAGLILLVFPGIIWSIKYGYYSYGIIDQDMGVIESLAYSSKITMGYKWQILLFKIVTGLIGILGLLALGVGFLVAFPVISIADAWVYRQLAKE